MYSLLKSSDDFTTTSNGSEGELDNDRKPRPTLPEPFWISNVNFTPQLTLTYQIKLQNLADVLERDQIKLQNIKQPNMVQQQLAQLYQELEDSGEAIKPLLEADATPSCISTGSSSAAEEYEAEAMTKVLQQRRQVSSCMHNAASQ